MWADRAVERLGHSEQANRIALKVQERITAFYARMPPAQRDRVEDALHGKYIGHPLHPPLTDVVLGALTACAALDLLDSLGLKRVRAGADATLALALLATVPTAASGASDWQHAEGRARPIGLAHAGMNSVASLMGIQSLLLRARGKRRRARLSALLSLLVAMASAYLGGDLLSRRLMGVDHSRPIPEPADFTAVLQESELAEGRPRGVEVDGGELVLVRADGQIRAYAGRCPHMGARLAEGRLDGDFLVCPWHGSCFDVHDGSVAHGPAVFPLPSYETRVMNGQVEVRRVGA